MGLHSEALNTYLEGFEAISPDSDAEPFLSWQRCEGCQQVAGDRYDCHGIGVQDRELYAFTLCTDCVLYLANDDQIDDETYLQNGGRS